MKLLRWLNDLSQYMVAVLALSCIITGAIVIVRDILAPHAAAHHFLYMHFLERLVDVTLKSLKAYAREMSVCFSLSPSEMLVRT